MEEVSPLKDVFRRGIHWIQHKTYWLIDNYIAGESFTPQMLLSLFIPLLVDQILVSIINMLNSAMVSSSGAEAVSAVSMVDSLNLFLTNFFIAVATGGTVVVAQYRGRHETEKSGVATAQAVTSAFVISLLVGGLIIVFCQQVLMLLFGQAEQKVMDNAYVYLIGCCISYPFFAIFQAVSGALRGMGDTRASMMLSVSMNGLYVLLNLFFINLLGMGILGVCISLNISRFFGCVGSMFYLLRSKKELRIRLKHFLKIQWPMQRSIMLIGVPSATETMFFHGGKILMQTFIVSLGTMSMTANAIASSISALFYIPGNAISLTIVTVVGQCIGAGCIEEAKGYIKSFNRTAMLLSVACILLILPFTPLLYQMYNPPDAVTFDTFAIIAVCAVGLPTLWPRGFITPGALRAAGDARFTLVASLLSMWLVRVMLGYVLAIVFHVGVVGIWIAMVLEWGVRGIIFSLRERRDKWYRHKVIT